MNALTAMKTAEQTLAGAIDAATATIDTIATSNLDEAMARLQHAADNARLRLAGSMAKMNSIVAGVTADVEQLARGILEDVATAKDASKPAAAPIAVETVLPEPSLNGHTSTPTLAQDAPEAKMADTTTLAIEKPNEPATSEDVPVLQPIAVGNYHDGVVKNPAFPAFDHDEPVVTIAANSPVNDPTSHSAEPVPEVPATEEEAAVPTPAPKRRKGRSPRS